VAAGDPRGRLIDEDQMDQAPLASICVTLLIGIRRGFMASGISR
jgi:hypothetical protein